MKDFYLSNLLDERNWNFGAGDPWAEIEPSHRPNIPIVQAFAGL